MTRTGEIVGPDENRHGPGLLRQPGPFLFWAAVTLTSAARRDYSANNGRNLAMSERDFNNAEVGFAEAVTLMLQLGYLRSVSGGLQPAANSASCATHKLRIGARPCASSMTCSPAKGE